MKFKPYPEYKQAEIHEIETIPSNWEVKRVKHIGRVENGGTPTSDPEHWGGTIPFITPPDLRTYLGREISSVSRYLTKLGLLEGSNTVPAGSVVISSRAPIGYVSLTSECSSFNQGCLAVIPDPPVSALYLTYLFLNLNEFLNSLGRGTTFTELSSTAFASARIAMPPVNEQRAIAGFLDRETAKIDELIAKQTELIATLRERRAALIAHTVTKGLNPHAKLVDSGTEWIGCIPENWEMKPARYLGRVANGGTPPSDVENWNGSIPFITPPDLRQYLGSKVFVVGRYLTARGVAAGSNMVPPDSVLVSSRAPIGYVATTSECSAFNQGCFAIVPNDRVFANYLAYLLLSGTTFLNSLGRGTTFTELSSGTFAGISLPQPPLSEQREIAAYLDRETEKIDTLIAKTEEFIELSAERRSALISAAVTGQIDVRDEAGAA